jgi:hypothetical protein
VGSLAHRAYKPVFARRARLPAARSRDESRF